MTFKSRMVGLISISNQVVAMVRLGAFLGNRVPVIGVASSMLVDRLILLLFALDVSSRNMFVSDLRIPHPAGVLLGGNGIRSPGRVLINAGVKFVGKSPADPEYLALHRRKSVFVLGDRVMIGANSVLVGPLEICDDVVIGAMSLVTQSILTPGVYVGSPARRIGDSKAEEWF